MTQQLPPLNALRTFLIVARHLSFTKAAEELSVTPAAVTHQIKALEEHLGVQLLHRTKRSVVVTEAGQACLPELREGFEKLHMASLKAQSTKGRSVLTVSVAPAFASKWLLPRLDSFSTAYPDIDVRVSATAQVVDLRDGEIDLAVRFGTGPYEGAHVDRLLSEDVAPMCSPELLRGSHPLEKPSDLRHHKLIHDLSVPPMGSRPDWEAWLRKARAKGVDATRGVRFTLADLALQAAINGYGVVLGRCTLAHDDIVAGKLAMPFKLSLPMKYAYFVVTPIARASRSCVVTFRNWLLSVASVGRA